ncbi:hypothetical protein MEK_01930 [Candida albicans 12C]|nr:hypothetical protein MEK_01930 [Candida albicans 12C]
MFQKQKVSPWEYLQEATLVKWVNTKLIEDTLSPQTPTSSCKNISETINNLTSDLHDSLVLTKLVNRLIYEVTLNPDHPMNKKANLYYLTPIYTKPTFKLQKLENLSDLLKFLNLILSINVSSISPENIFDGDLKLTLGLVWSLFIFNTASVFPGTPTYSGIKTTLLKWINGILTDTSIRNFSKDWANEPETILCEIISNYDANIPCGMNLSELLDYLEESIAFPKLIEPDDFQYNDEKCLIVFLVELYKIFEIEKSYNNVAVDNSLGFDQVITATVEIFKLKSKYESEALKLSNQLNTLINQLSLDISDLKNDFTMDILSCLKLLEDSILDSTKLTHFQNSFNHLNVKLTSLVNILQRFQNFRFEIKSELVYQSYPQIIQILGSIKSMLQSFGDIDYIPASKTLNIDPISTKLEQLITLDSLILAEISEVILNTNSEELFIKLSKLKDVKTKHKSVKTECETTIEYFLGFFRKLEMFESSLQSSPPLKYFEARDPSDFDITPDIFNQFKTVILRHNNCHHDKLFRVLQEQFVPSDFSNTTLEFFTRLIPIKASPISSNDSSFDLTSSTSVDDDDIFDELQQKLDFHLSLTNNKIYDIQEFIRRFENGFKL